ncbi:MAG: aminotransferase class I/II-fold pyridoxal phosphate-dependent enzyme [Acidiferrobacterales bacterium]|nr:aminotransferase class I/II-fold pyridoxal phosphate-dependent enzyme [Acidiferrobacterales bacterium]
MKLSALSDQIQTSPILTIAAAINARKAAGETIYNLTVGDFDASIFPIPDALTKATLQAYRDHQTNYPGAFGLPEIRQGVAALLNRTCGLDYQPEDVIIASGSRPVIYAVYRAVVDPGEKVVFPAPSWNNEHYASMLNAESTVVETHPENNFMPSAQELAPHLDDAVLLALCSPQNPTGTVLSDKDLIEICQLILKINASRSEQEKPLYVMFDQVYSMLTFGNTHFSHPLKLCPEIRDYAVFVDGMSKAFAGTGIRVGWATGASHIIEKMVSIIAHVGAWAPKPDQKAVGQFLAMDQAVDDYLTSFRGQLSDRLDGFYDGFQALKEKGHDVDAIAPQAAIYLSAKINIIGKRTVDGKKLETEDDVQQYLMNEARIGVLPFSWFGAPSYGNWFRISVGTCKMEEIPMMMQSLESALDKLH